MQPISDTVHTRPWHWGIAIVCAPGAELPDDLDEDAPVTVGAEALVLRVRHAQDQDAEKADEAWDWGTATFHVQVVVERPEVGRLVLSDVMITTPDGRVALGDEDGEIIVSVPTERTRVVVTADAVPDEGLDEVWVDLIPVLPDMGIGSLDEELADLDTEGPVEDTVADAAVASDGDLEQAKDDADGRESGVPADRPEPAGA